MIGHHLKDSLYWLHLFCFKLRTFEHEADKLSRRQAIRVFLQVYPWFLLFGLILLTIIGLACGWQGVPFHWQRAFIGAVKGGVVFWLFGWLFLWLPGRAAGLAVGLVVWLIGGLGAGLFGGLGDWLFSWSGIGVLIGSFVGLGLGMGVRVGGGPLVRNFGEFLGGLIGGLIVWLFIGLLSWASGQAEAKEFTIAYLPVFIIFFALFFGRLYYWPFHLAQLWLARRSGNWQAHIRQSPVHWDETIGAPLPWLSDWLFEIAKADRQAGLAEVFWIAAERPFQRKAAQAALLKLVRHDLQQITTIAQLTQVSKTLEFLPAMGKSSMQLAINRLKKVAPLAHDYLLRHTPNGQYRALLDVQSELQSIQTALALLPTPVGPTFQQIAAQWLTMVNTAEAELRARLPFENPFIAGNPLKEHEDNLFKGRLDLVVKLEEAIFTQRPTLLLYGRRRTGKTSTLLNLPRLMSSQFVAVFINCQDQKFADSDAMFCYHLTRALHDELVKRKLAEGLAQPDKSEFEPHAFTRLDEFLDELEAHSRRIGKQILLTFDEYERLEEGIGEGKLTHAVLNQIRAIVQHRERLIVLFSGSHRLEELQTVNWSDYLINVQTLHLSFLTRDEARELIEHPTLEFALGYAPGVVDRVLDLTHGQPYLVQALGSELVNLINREKRKEATLADLDVAVGRVLVAVEAYFENNWRDCNEAEQAVLRALATQQADELSATERQRALLSLSRKELVEPKDTQWQFTVELFRLWVRQEKTAELLAVTSATQQHEEEFVSAFHA